MRPEDVQLAGFYYGTALREDEGVADAAPLRSHPNTGERYMDPLATYVLAMFGLLLALSGLLWGVFSR